MTLPLSMPGLAAAALLILIATVADRATPAVLGGPDGMMAGDVMQLRLAGLRGLGPIWDASGAASRPPATGADWWGEGGRSGRPRAGPAYWAAW